MVMMRVLVYMDDPHGGREGFDALTRVKNFDARGDGARALNSIMSGFAVELHSIQPSKDVACTLVSMTTPSQNIPSSPQSKICLPPPDLVSIYKRSLTAESAESDSRLNEPNSNASAPATRKWRSIVHAQSAVRPQKSLAHHLTHIHYSPPEQSITSWMGIRQHIAHYLHLYRTGLTETLAYFLKSRFLTQPCSLQNSPSSPSYLLTSSLFAARLCWNPFVRSQML